MSVNIQEKIGRPASCVLACGEVYDGILEGVDGSFNVLLSSCRCVSEGGEELASFSSSTRNMKAPHGQLAKRTLIRGENVVYIGFD